MAAIDAWLKQMADYLISVWGLDSAFADRVAKFYLYLHQYGLSPVITSGYRSPEKKAELQRRYAAGDNGIIVKPAENTKHDDTNFIGKPASHAIDISTNNPALAAQIATAININAGYYFKTPDRVHFYI
jgi:hypothetical protein